MIRVNLLAGRTAPAAPRVWLPPHRRGTAAGILLLLLTTASVGGWWWQLQHETAGLDARIRTGEADLTRLRAAAALVNRAIARKGELSEKLALIDRLRAAQRGPVSLLATLSRSLPDGLWLMELKQQGTIVQLEGRALSLTAVSDFVERLQDSGLFDRPVEIVSTGMETLDEASVVRFAVRAQALGTSAVDAPSPPAVRRGN